MLRHHHHLRVLPVLAAGTLTAATIGFAAPARAITVLPAECAPSGSTVTCTYTYTGAEQQFMVPDGVTSLDLTLAGGHGGKSGSGASLDGGEGALVVTTLSPVTPGTTYYVEVGGNAFHDDTCQTGVDCKGGFNGGGSSGGSLGAGRGGGGGGASELRTISRNDAGTLESRVDVTAGGGGAGQSSVCAGGDGGNGDVNGSDGTACPQPGGTAGSAGANQGGAAGHGDDESGQPADSGDGQPGSLGLGGNGGFSGGGAGGGGYYGGGGGGNNTVTTGTTTFTGGAGGGGGGSFSIVGGGSFSADDTATPRIVITYTVPGAATAPTIGGTPPAGGVGEPYAFDFTTTGDPSPSVSRTAGSLPPGLALSSSGHLSGTPTRAGTYHFTVRAENSAGSASEHVTMTIRPVPSIRSGGASTVEGDVGNHPLTMTLTLTRASTLPVTVKWTTANSSAKAPQDFVAASGTVTFNPGQTSHTLAVSVRGDRIHEPDEAFYVLLHNATHARIATPNVRGGIRNDD